MCLLWLHWPYMDFREFRPYTIKPLSYELHTASRIITNGHQSHIPTIFEATEQESKDLKYNNFPIGSIAGDTCTFYKTFISFICGTLCFLQRHWSP